MLIRLPALVLISQKNFLCFKKSFLLDIVYNIDTNEWNGEQMLQLKVVDFNISEAY